MAEFKIIEQANEIADGDYILTVHNGEIKKVAKEDANVGGGNGGVVYFHAEVTHNGDLYTATVEDGVTYDVVKNTIDDGKQCVFVVHHAIGGGTFYLPLVANNIKEERGDNELLFSGSPIQIYVNDAFKVVVSQLTASSFGEFWYNLGSMPNNHSVMY